MPEPWRLLDRYGIRLQNYSAGEHALPCPQCSAQRQPAHRRLTCLSVHIEPNGRCYFRCHHCSLEGPKHGDPELIGLNLGNGGGAALFSYIYSDKNGVPCWRKVNNKPHEPPYYWQPSDGAGGWIKKKEREEREKRGEKFPRCELLYHLDEVAKAIAEGKEVVIVEGEKDADTLRRLGFVATCSPHGAAKLGQRQKWKPEHSAQLAGGNIVVMGDHDAPGHAHAETTCKLSLGVAKRVRRLDLALHWPAISDGKDVSDWLDHGGGTAAKLRELVDAAPDYQTTFQPKQAAAAAAAALPAFVELDDFVAYMPMHNYIFLPTMEPWPGSSVASRLPPMDDGVDKDGKPKFIPATAWLDKNSPVDQMTWFPGRPPFICDEVFVAGDFIPAPGKRVLNLYRPPRLDWRKGDPAKAKIWIDHVYKLYPNEAEELILRFAHRAQKPEEKINHCIVLGGDEGIGKDTLLQPVFETIGRYNVGEATPEEAMGQFNPHVRNVVLRINEARDLGEVNRFAFHNRCKLLMASSPYELYVNDKHLRKYAIPNVVFIIITTNHRTDGVYFTEQDRRHFCCWSDLKITDFDQPYWDAIHGLDPVHVAAYLMTLDISAFNPKLPPRKTAMWHAIAGAGHAPEESEMADVIDALAQKDANGAPVPGTPIAFTLAALIEKATKMDEDRLAEEARRKSYGHALIQPKQQLFSDWIADRKNARIVSHRLEACGYSPVHNPSANRDRWLVGKARVVIYARDDRSADARAAAVAEMQKSKDNVVLDVSIP